MDLLFAFSALKLYIALNAPKYLLFFLDLHSHSTFATVTGIFHNIIEIILPITDYMYFGVCNKIN